MKTKKLRIVSIDDNHQNLSLIQQALAAHFDIVSTSGEESIEELVRDCEPDIILLDIMLNETNGYDICRQLKSLPWAKHIIIIFISSLTSLSDKLAAYEAGGDDYICKPVNLDELECKLETYEKRINEKYYINQQMEEASQAAFTSMQQANELGQLVDFIARALIINDLDELYNITRSTIASFGLGCAVEFRMTSGNRQYPPGNITKLESEILELGKRAKRIVTFGQNLLFNSPRCSLLIKKLPENDELQAGRLRDLIAILLPLVNNRLENIEQQQIDSNNRKLALTELKNYITASFEQISGQQAETSIKLASALDHLEEIVSCTLKTISTTNEQDLTIFRALDETRENLLNTYQSSTETDFDLNTLHALFYNIP